MSNQTHLDHIFFYDLNPQAKPLIILFHGHRSDAQRILPLAQFLAQQQFHVLLPDLPGSGHSPLLAQSHSVKHLSQAMAQWLNHYLQLHYSPTYYLVGLSLGGSVALKTLDYLQPLPQHLYLYSAPTHPNQLTPHLFQKLLIPFIKFLPLNLSVKLTSIITHCHWLMSVLYHLTYPQLNSSIIEFEINQWLVQQPQSLIESIQDLLIHPLTLNSAPNPTPTTYFHPKTDDYLNLNLIKQQLPQLLSNLKFQTLNLTYHVPKGPLKPQFFQPLLSSLLSQFN